MISVWVTHHLLQSTCAHTWCIPQDRYQGKSSSISYILPAGMFVFQYHQLGHINSNAQPKACFFLHSIYAHCVLYVTAFHCVCTYLQYARKQWRLTCPISEQKLWRYCFASFAPIWVSFCIRRTLVLINSPSPVCFTSFLCHTGAFTTITPQSLLVYWSVY